jgi:hypothetical protein
MFSDRLLEFRTPSTAVRGLNAVAGNLALLGSNRGAVLEGLGRIAIDSITEVNVKGTIQFSKPRLNGPIDLTLAAQLENLSLFAEGPKASLQLKGSGIASALVIGAMRVSSGICTNQHGRDGRK